jgi:hypothetical protein
LVALLTAEPFSDRAETFAAQGSAFLIVSDFAAAEYASAMARHCRTGDFTIEQARTALASFDGWVAGAAHLIEVLPVDMALAAGFLRRLTLPLRTPDAIHIAMTQRIGASLVTFDRRLAAAAQALGVPVAEA